MSIACVLIAASSEMNLVIPLSPIFTGPRLGVNQLLGTRAAGRETQAESCKTDPEVCERSRI